MRLWSAPSTSLSFVARPRGATSKARKFDVPYSHTVNRFNSMANERKIIGNDFSYCSRFSPIIIIKRSLYPPPPDHLLSLVSSSANENRKRWTCTVDPSQFVKRRRTEYTVYCGTIVFWQSFGSFETWFTSSVHSSTLVFRHGYSTPTHDWKKPINVRKYILIFNLFFFNFHSDFQWSNKTFCVL